MTPESSRSQASPVILDLEYLKSAAFITDQQRIEETLRRLNQRALPAKYLL